MTACVFAALAALVHVYIFVLESVRWRHPATRRVFGTTEETAAITAPLAYNQGFYNLFLALGAPLGIVLWWTGHHEVGKTLMLFCTGSMVAAATVLITTGSSYLRAALSQGTIPLIGLVLTLLA